MKFIRGEKQLVCLKICENELRIWRLKKKQNNFGLLTSSMTVVFSAGRRFKLSCVLRVFLLMETAQASLYTNIHLHVSYVDMCDICT